MVDGFLGQLVLLFLFLPQHPLGLQLTLGGGFFADAGLDGEYKQAAKHSVNAADDKQRLIAGDAGLIVGLRLLAEVKHKGNNDRRRHQRPHRTCLKPLIHHHIFDKQQAAGRQHHHKNGEIGHAGIGAQIQSHKRMGGVGQVLNRVGAHRPVDGVPDIQFRA